jgi:hypothetical protein
MRLADRVAQCRTPFIVQSTTNKALTHLNGASDFAEVVARCPIRYVLSDDLTRLCTALAYSKGARSLACADLLRVPVERVWVEWCEAAYQAELGRYGFKPCDPRASRSGRCGALVRSSPDGRRGSVRTFWSGAEGVDVLASSMEAYFDLDTPDGEEPDPPDGQYRPTISVSDGAGVDADILRRCFRFRYERTWADYYAREAPPHDLRRGIERHALGTIAIEIPVLLALFLLLATRSGLPRRPTTFERLNRTRAKIGKPPLLDFIEVRSPVLPEYTSVSSGEPVAGRRSPRLHQVRGHLVRRGSQLFWRVPHLRGSARSGVIRSRTVTWTFDPPVSRWSNEVQSAHDSRVGIS